MTQQAVTEPFDYENKRLRKDPDLLSPVYHQEKTQFEFPVLQKILPLVLAALFGAAIAYSLMRERLSNTEILPVSEESNSELEKIDKPPLQIAKSIETTNQLLVEVQELEHGKPSESVVSVKPWMPHIITPGETMRNLCAKYQISIQEIHRHNSGKFTPRIGRTIQLPPADFPVHTVKSGETVYGIAANNGVTSEKISKLNGLVRNRIKTGQVLRLH